MIHFSAIFFFFLHFLLFMHLNFMDANNGKQDSMIYRSHQLKVNI